MNLKACLFLITAVIFISACEKLKKDPESLAIRHCSSCHAFPDPSLLDKKTWEDGVFPEMAFRMGLDVSRLPQTNEHELREILEALPPSPLVSPQEWETIRKYYIGHAPDSLVQSEDENQKLQLNQFTAAIFRLPVRNNTMFTMVKYDSANKNIFLGTRKGKLYTLTSSLQLKDSIQLPGPPSGMIPHANESYMISCMGNMDPNDQPVGSVIRLTPREKNVGTLIDSLKIPVYLEEADLNNDGKDDIIVSAFGNFSGELLAYEQRDGSYVQHIVHNFPGTRKTIVRDFNNDGMPDILALISQADEQIALFTNRGNFRFSYQILLKFPPVYGSSFFEIYDFNNDGSFDILYTNGNNADFSPILKPYHGVRIFLNNRKNNFSESWFYPLHGASMAKAADFDKDGDLDIAAISFFPDFKKHPEHSFIYFKNDQNNFIPYITELAASSRWITMETGDFDGDQDTDLILGALTFPNGVPDSLFQIWKEKDASLLVLRNNLR